VHSYWFVLWVSLRPAWSLPLKDRGHSSKIVRICQRSRHLAAASSILSRLSRLCPAPQRDMEAIENIGLKLTFSPLSRILRKNKFRCIYHTQLHRCIINETLVGVNNKNRRDLCFAPRIKFLINGRVGV